MIKKITYENKVAIQNDEEIARKNKVTDEDLNEIKEAVNNNADELEETKQSIEDLSNNKVEKVEGKGLSSNDFTNEFKQKLEELENYDDTEVKQDILNLDINKASKTELQEIAIALQAELKATRKDLQAGTLEGEDTGESLYLQDSSDARFREFGIGGNSKQETREGYNKFDIQKWLDNDLNVAHGTENSKSKDKISLTASEAGDCFTNTYAIASNVSNNQQIIDKFGIEVKPNTAYTVYLDKNNTEKDSFYAFFCDAEYNYISNKNKMSIDNYNIINFTTPENAKYLTVRLGVFNAGKTIEFSNIILLEGTYTKETIPKYEQYGAMPSLKFPSEVKTVKDSANVTICNKNFFDKNAETIKGTYSGNLNIDNDNDSMTFESTDFKWATVNKIAWLIELPNLEKDIYISTKSIIRPYTNNAGLYYKFVESKNITLPNGAISDIVNISASANGNQVRVTPTTKYLMILLQSQYVDASASTGLPENRSVSVSQLMVSYSNDAEYTIHKGQTFTIDVQQEMLEGDYLDLNNEEEVHTWNKVVLDGVNNEITNKHSTIFTETNGFYPLVLEGKDNTHENGNSGLAHCNYLKTINEGIASIAVKEDCIWWEGKYRTIYLSLPFLTIDEANEKLQELYNAGNPLTIYYKLAEPVRLPFTDTQKAIAKQIRETLHSYKDGTHVYSVDNVSPIFNAKYTKDLNAVINNLSQNAIGGN